MNTLQAMVTGGLVCTDYEMTTEQYVAWLAEKAAERKQWRAK